MDVAEHIDHLVAEGPALAAAAGRAGWDAAVPGCPDWTVRDLVTHVGGVHRWATAIVSGVLTENDETTGAAVGTGPGDGELLEWFRVGHARLVAALRAAPADLECFTFLAAPSPLAFWARRQAHETAVHRADAQAAAGGEVTAMTAAFAQDGIGELLHGFARRRSNAIPTAGTLALRAGDGPDWLVGFGGERIEAREGDGAPADAQVSGSSSELYLWLWNRPSAATVSGDPAVADLWRRVRVRWS